jgi:hypothetical protein
MNRLFTLQEIQQQDLVLTPGGFRSRSLVHLAPEKSRVRFTRKSLQIQNKLTGEKLLLNKVLNEDQKIHLLGSGWVAYAGWDIENGNLLNQFETTWTVPPNPVNQSDQTIFLFNGIQNRGSVYGILQPVLQWGVSAAGGGQFWSVGSWYVTSDGHALYTNLVPVNPGDTLTGVMRLLKNSAGLCDYRCEFSGIPETRREFLGIPELVWANITMEAYSIDTCDQYPDSPSTLFHPILMQTQKGTTPVWIPVNAITDCGQHCEVWNNGTTSAGFDIFYH